MSIRIIYIFLLVLFGLSSCVPVIRFSTKQATSQSGFKSYYAKNSNKCFENGKLIKSAEKWLGVSYVYGGSTSSGIDCSAFVQNVYSDLGIIVPRTAAEQFTFTDRIMDNDKEVGDLVFFQKDSDKISHVAIYIGNNEVIHASTSRGVVRENLYQSYLTNMFVGFGRICQQ